MCTDNISRTHHIHIPRIYINTKYSSRERRFPDFIPFFQLPVVSFSEITTGGLIELGELVFTSISLEQIIDHTIKVSDERAKPATDP